MRVDRWEFLASEAKFQPSLMADLCLVSLRQLERYFTFHFKQSPGKWARELRCRLARDLIARGWSNKAVAAELHFGNESHLCHEFIHHYGVPPQAFATSFATAQGNRKSVA